MALADLTHAVQMQSGDYHDIVSGSNCAYSAGLGYDMVTGIGTPVANQLVPDFVPATSKGTVAFDAATYQFGTYASITVADLDLISDASCPVTLTSSAGDSETLTLTAAGGGVFTGTILVSDGPAVVGDGILENAPGGTITVTYHDANDGTGHPATVTAEATTFAPLQIHRVQPAASRRRKLSVQRGIDGNGRFGGYTWSVPASAGNYTESNPGSGWLGGGVAQGWHAEGGTWSLALPWAFPFYGQDYTSVNVSGNGYLDFTSSADFYIHIAIPCWKSVCYCTLLGRPRRILPAGDDIYVTSNANYVAVRWQAHTAPAVPGRLRSSALSQWQRRIQLWAGL